MQRTRCNKDSERSSSSGGATHLRVELTRTLATPKLPNWLEMYCTARGGYITKGQQLRTACRAASCCHLPSAATDSVRSTCQALVLDLGVQAVSTNVTTKPSAHPQHERCRAQAHRLGYAQSKDGSRAWRKPRIISTSVLKASARRSHASRSSVSCEHAAARCNPPLGVALSKAETVRTARFSALRDSERHSAAEALARSRRRWQTLGRQASTPEGSVLKEQAGSVRVRASRRLHA